MVTEKVHALDQSRRAVGSTRSRFDRASSSWSRLGGGMAAGRLPGMGAWLGLAEANLALTAALIAAPSAALAPFHTRVTANARRLAR